MLKFRFFKWRLLIAHPEEIDARVKLVNERAHNEAVGEIIDRLAEPKDFFEHKSEAKARFLERCLPCLDCLELKINLRDFFSTELQDAYWVGKHTAKRQMVERLEEERTGVSPSYIPGLVRAVEVIKR